MKLTEIIYWILILLSPFVVADVLYWELRYLSALPSPRRYELLIGASITVVYSWPVWVGLPMAAMANYKKFSKTKITLSFLPAAIIFIPVDWIAKVL